MSKPFWEYSSMNKKRAVDHTAQLELVRECFEKWNTFYGCSPTNAEIISHTRLTGRMVTECIDRLLGEDFIIEMHGARYRKYALSVPSMPEAVKEIKDLAERNRYHEILAIIDDYYGD